MIKTVKSKEKVSEIFTFLPTESARVHNLWEKVLHINKFDAARLFLSHIGLLPSSERIFLGVLESDPKNSSFQSMLNFLDQTHC